MCQFKAYLSTFLLILLTSCAVGPNFHSPIAPQTSRYTASPMPAKTTSANSPGGKSQHFLFDRDIPAQWWGLFRSRYLDDLIRKGIANNPNLQAAQASLRQAQENLRAEIGAGLFPSINGSFSAERERFSGQQFGQNNSPGSTFSLYNASVNVTYTLDVFGGIRRQIESFRALVDFQRFEVEAAYLTLTANIATSAITEASLRAQIDATRNLVQLQEKQLAIVKTQFTLGGASGSDILLQETQVQQTRSLLPPLQKNLYQVRHALAVLVGELPSQSDVPIFRLEDITLPRVLPISVPSNLVRQRPDVRAAEALMHQASALIGVATANLLPQFPLSANFGYTSNSLNTLFTHNAETWSIIGQVTQPIFQGGALLAQRRAAIAAYDAAAAQYKQTVLTAFQNVADALRAIEMDAQALKDLSAAEISARKTLILTQEQYGLGGASYVSLLIAQRQTVQATITRIQAQAARYADTAALFQALGGGWWNRPPEETKEVLSPLNAEKSADRLGAIKMKTSKGLFNNHAFY